MKVKNYEIDGYWCQINKTFALQLLNRLQCYAKMMRTRRSFFILFMSCSHPNAPQPDEYATLLNKLTKHDADLTNIHKHTHSQ